MNRTYALIATLCLALPGCAGANAPSIPRSRSDDTTAIVRASGFRVMHFFGKGTDGAGPQGEPIVANGTFYGTTAAGGKNSKGTMYSATAAGEEKVLHNFGGAQDGVNPQARMTVANGMLYGTTLAGGTKTLGSIFRIARSGAKETVLHSFAGGKDGSAPRANLTLFNGDLYGTTQLTGANNAGTVFSITPSGKYRILHQFAPAKGDGGTPSAGLIAIGDTLYGTTQVGGSHGAGTVFSITPGGTEKVLYSFFGGNDGQTPYAGLTSVKGTLYGTTAFGGTHGYGTAFTISLGGSEQIVHNFAANGDGAAPEAAMILVGGMLYGTTSGGGSPLGDGAVFQMSTSGSVKVLHGFNGKDGSSPETGLTFSHGVLYGTASRGGKYGGGSLFAITP